MKYQITLILILCFKYCCLGQFQINLNLKHELDSILNLDQIFREYIDTNTGEMKKDSIAKATGYIRNELDTHAWEIINKIDSANLKRIEELIKEYGYVGKSLVGEPTNKTMWYVIQHSDKIDNYLPIIENAGKKGEISFTLVAMMKDRWLMRKGKEQVYGTQVKGFKTKNKTTGNDEWLMFVWPIEDAKNVNIRRKEAGFSTTVEENAKNLGVEYKEFTLDEISKMPKY